MKYFLANSGQLLRFVRLLLLTPLVLPLCSPCQAQSLSESAQQTGCTRGICLLVGEFEKAEVARLLADTELMVVHCLSDAGEVAARRAALAKSGLLGSRAYVIKIDPGKIPLAANLVDLCHLSRSVNDERMQTEALRVLHPGGTAWLDKQAVVKQMPKAFDSWSHPYHGPDNNPLSQDQAAKAPYLTHFLAEPFFCPMGEVTVIAGGRMFKAFGNRSPMKITEQMVHSLWAFNAYNGTLLWKKSLDPEFMVHRNTMIATADKLIVGGSKSCKIYDAASGKLLREIRFEKNPAWKWMAVQGNTLYALVGAAEPKEKKFYGKGGGAWGWWKIKDYGYGMGKTFVAIDLETEKTLWRHQEEEPIDSRSVCMTGEQINFYSDDKFIAALDITSGKEMWRNQSAEVLQEIGPHESAQSWINGFSSTAYAKCTDKAIYFAGPTRKKLVALSAADGKLLWTYPHGDFQLVIRDDALYALGRTGRSKKLDLLTGRILADLNQVRGNCTRATGTVDSLFSRAHHHAGTLRIDVAKTESYRLPVMRPGCHDGVIASNGQLYWGPWMCACNLSLIGMISVSSAGDHNFNSTARQTERLTVAPQGPGKATPLEVARFEITERDWTTYRKDNTCSGAVDVALARQVREKWSRGSRTTSLPTAPIVAGGLVFSSGSDGIVRAIDQRSGKVRWTACTGGAVHFPPVLSEGRVFVGSCDGYIYAFEATTGRTLWRFRAAPEDRRIPVYGKLYSTWPVASGVLVEKGTLYAAAGIISQDGTYLYALDAASGQIRWQNNSSGQLLSGQGEASGVSVQGHLLLYEGKLYLAGGNVISPASYDANSGACLNSLSQAGIWKKKSPRGRDLALVGGKVIASAELLYGPRQIIKSKYFGNFFLQTELGKNICRGQGDGLLLGDDDSQVNWKATGFHRIIALAQANNFVVVGSEDIARRGQLTAIDLKDGSVVWKQSFSSPVVPWGIAIAADGEVIVNLEDGRTLCFGK